MSNIGARIHFEYDGTLVWSINNTVHYKIAVTQPQCNGLEYTPDRVDTYTINSNAGDYGQVPGIAFNFPGECQISKIQIKTTGIGSPINAFVSEDSTDGFDGAWTQVLNGTQNLTAYTLFTFGLLPTTCRWLKIVTNAPSNWGVMSLYLFGEYQSSERYQFWDAAGNYQLTGDYPLQFPDSNMITDYHQTQSFKIKNTDSSPHSYQVNIEPIRNNGDALITNGWTLSTDGGSTKQASVTVGPVSAGAFSGAITVCADFLKTANPGDGYHYWYIDVLES